VPTIQWWPTTARPTIKVSSFMRASPHNLQYKKTAWVSHLCSALKYSEVSVMCSKETQKANRHNKRLITCYSHATRSTAHQCRNIWSTWKFV
jgi:hypothetical protein